MYVGIRESEARAMVAAALKSAGLRDGECLTLFGGTPISSHELDTLFTIVQKMLHCPMVVGQTALSARRTLRCSTVQLRCTVTSAMSLACVLSLSRFNINLIGYTL